MPAPSVVVASFGRPQLLRSCLASLAAQEPAPADVVVAVRRGDEETRAVAAAAGGNVRVVEVGSPGHLPPLSAAVRAATGDVVCFVDDDAEAWPGWTRALLRHYADPVVGGAGGLVVQPGEGERETRTRICRFGATGRFSALEAHRIPAEWGARNADALRGTNMSFRRELLLDYPWDARLNGGAATDFEVDLCAWVRRRGFRLVYDPDAIVTHHLGPRPDIGRDRSRRNIETYSHNLVYVAGKALPPVQAAVTVADAFVIGNRRSYGFATAVVDTIAGRPPKVRDELLPALRGKLAGIASLAAYARHGAARLDDGTGT